MSYPSWLVCAEIPAETREFIHHLKYDGKDCISEHLRVLFPQLHSAFCDEACNDLADYVASEIDLHYNDNCCFGD